jgi:hypothetical protein
VCGSAKKRRKEGSIMRKTVVTLAILLLATPALAAVRIIVEDQGGLTAAIKYETDGDKVRAFALDITVTGGATIDDISGYIKGESTEAAPGFGIFPANFSRHITVNADTGEVDDWDVAEYTPVADAADPGALGGLGTDGITVEMGGLWYPPDDGSVNAPGNAGTLCLITLSDEGNVSADENVTRGGVVLTDPSVTPTVDLSAATDVLIAAVTDCFPSSYSTYNDWVAMNKPACWCAPPDGSGYQCDGDVDGATETFFKYRVYGNDLNAVVANWKKKIDDPDLDPCADIDHKSETFFKYRVYGNDLATVVANWKKKDADLPGDCPRSE